jgi:anti-sigma factor (TIGR02949 family)
MTSFAGDPCAKCEEVLQPFLDRELSEGERALAEAHLDQCAYCRKRYRFEVSLRRYVRQVAAEPMPLELKARLAALRTPLL